MTTLALPAAACMVHMSLRGSVPLSFVPDGKEVVVQAIRGGMRMRRRLTELGLHQGASIRVLKNDAHGPLIVAVKEHGRLALGRGMAYHILVTITYSTPH